MMSNTPSDYAPEELDDSWQVYESLVSQYEQCFAAGTSLPPSLPGESELPQELQQRLLQAKKSLLVLESICADHDFESMFRDGSQAGDIPLLDRRRGASGSIEAPKIGKFRILRELGRGTNGVVFLAQDEVIRRQVALKLPRPEILFTPSLRARFLREAEAAGMLSHPGIAQIHEAGEIDGVSYVASEYVEGENLATWMEHQREPLDFRVIAGILWQLSQAVSYAHSVGVLHRDIKPSNVMVSASNEGRIPGGNSPFNVPAVTLVDFGLAKFVNRDDTQSAYRVVMGTYRYMAPEQARGAAHASAASDIYSLGAVFYELLTGTPAREAECDAELLTQMLVSEVEAPRVRVARVRSPGHRQSDETAVRTSAAESHFVGAALIPRDLETVCLKCLASRPADRFNSAAELADDLARCMRGEPVLAQRQSRMETLLRWSGRHPKAVGTALVAAVTLIVLLASIFWQTGQRKVAQEKAELARSYELRQRIRTLIDAHEPSWSVQALALIREVELLQAGKADADTIEELKSARAACLTGVDFVEIGTLNKGFHASFVTFNYDGTLLAMGHNRDSCMVPVEIWKKSRDTFVPWQKVAFPSHGNEHPTRKGDGVRSMIFVDRLNSLFVGTRSGWIHEFNYQSNPPVRRSWHAHTDAVIGLAAFEGQDKLFSASHDKTLKAFRFADHSLCCRETRDTKIGSLSTCVTDPQLVLADGELRTREATQPLYRDYSQVAELATSNAAGTALAITYDRGRRLSLYNMARTTKADELTEAGLGVAHTQRIQHVVFAATSPLLATADELGTVKVWSGSSKTLLTTITVPADCLPHPAFDFQSTTLAIGTSNGVRLFRIPPDTCSTTAFSSTEIRDFAMGAGRDFVLTATPEEFKYEKRPDELSQHMVRSIDIGTSYTHNMCGVGFPFDGDVQLAAHPSLNLFAVTCAGWQHIGMFDNDIRIRGKYHDVFADHSIDDLAFDRHGRYLWSVSQGPVTRDRMRTGVLTRTPAKPGSSEGEQAQWWNNTMDEDDVVSELLCVYPGDSLVAVGARNNAVAVLRQDPLVLLRSVRTGDRRVQRLALVNQDFVLVAGADNGELGIAKVEGGEFDWVSAHERRVTSIAVSRDHGLLATADERGSVRLWRLHAKIGGTKPQLESLIRMVMPARVKRLAFTPDSQGLIILVNGENALRVIQLNQVLGEN